MPRNLDAGTKCEHCKDELTVGLAVETSRSEEMWRCPSCRNWNMFDRAPTLEDKAFEVIEKRLCSEQTHPLLNPDSKHYQMVDGVEAICRMEDMYPPHELKIWAKITAMKYRLRIGSKDDVLKEAKKIKTYEAYYKYLEEKLNAN